jgi:hypothetical protein
MWELGAKETGVINPYFACNKCNYSEKEEYLEYPWRKPAPSFTKKKWSSFFLTLKINWET